jgi:hypothetical protein
MAKQDEDFKKIFRFDLLKKIGDNFLNPTRKGGDSLLLLCLNLTEFC